MTVYEKVGREMMMVVMSNDRCKTDWPDWATHLERWALEILRECVKEKEGKEWNTP